MKRMLIALVVLSLLVVACGDAGDGGGEEEAGSPTTSVATDPDTDATQPPSDNGSDGGSSASGLPPGGTGTVTVDGETYQSEWVGNCMIDEQFSPHPDDLDLTAGLGGIQALFLEISNQSLPLGEEPFEYMQVRVSLQLRDDSDQMVLYEDLVFVGTEDGVWYDNPDVAFLLAQDQEPEDEPLNEAPLELSGSNASGMVTFEGDTVVTFDLDYVEPVDCSL